MALFRGGIPTDLDVTRLRQAFGVPAPGVKIPYGDIERVLGFNRNTSRWKSVLTAWRRKLDRENNIILKALPGEGFKAMDGHDRVDFSGGLFKGGLRRLSRAASVASRTDRDGLDEEEVKALDHVQRTGAALRVQAATAARRLHYPDPLVTKSLEAQPN